MGHYEYFNWLTKFIFYFNLNLWIKFNQMVHTLQSLSCNQNHLVCSLQSPYTQLHNPHHFCSLFTMKDDPATTCIHKTNNHRRHLYADAMNNRLIQSLPSCFFISANTYTPHSLQTHTMFCRRCRIHTRLKACELVGPTWSGLNW